MKVININIKKIIIGSVLFLFFMSFFPLGKIVQGIDGTCKGGTTYPDCSRSPLIGSDCSDQGTGPDPTYLHNYCYREADCCKQDAMACCWAERKYCLPKSCGYSQKNGCSNGWGDDFPFGCLNAPVRNDGELPMDRNGNKIGANPTVAPTTLPVETPEPTIDETQPNPSGEPNQILPTTELLPMPTKAPVQQKILDSFPTGAAQNGNFQNNPISYPAFSFPSLSLPNLSPLCLKSKPYISMGSLNIAAQKPMGVVRSIFVSIINLDKNLENTINNEFSTIVNNIIKVIPYK